MWCTAFFTSHFLICKHLIQQKGTVDIQFFDQVYRHHQYPFVNTSLSQVISFRQFTLQLPNIEVEGVEDEDVEVGDKIYNRLIDSMEKILKILKDQKIKKNFK